MAKKEEEWTVHDIVIISVIGCLSYGAGIVLLYFKSLLGIGLIFVPTLFIIPALIEARAKIKRYLKEKRRIKRLLNSNPVIVGGVAQGHHKRKKQQPETFDCPVINDEASKGKLMRELGLWYEKPAKSSSFEEKKVDVVTPQKHERMNKLNAIFDYLETFGRIRFSYQAHVGNLRGADIGKSVKTEAKRRGLDVTVKDKGKDVIITMKRSEKRVV